MSPILILSLILLSLMLSSAFFNYFLIKKLNLVNKKILDYIETEYLDLGDLNSVNDFLIRLRKHLQSTQKIIDPNQLCVTPINKSRIQIQYKVNELISNSTVSFEIVSKQI